MGKVRARPRSKATFRVRDGELTIMGRPLFGGSAEELLQCLESLAASGQPSLVVTLNVDQTLNLQDDPAFARAVRDADMVIIDGMPIAWLGKLLGAAHTARHTGADLLPAASRRPWKLAITGGDDETASSAATALSRERASVHAVPFPMIAAVDDPAGRHVASALGDLGPDIVFLCLGSPKQELWYRHWLPDLPPAVYVGAGAAVDFAAQRVRRAPLWMQRLGLEWLFRLAQEPRRLATRYLIRGPRFLAVILRSVAAAVFRRTAP